MHLIPVEQSPNAVALVDKYLNILVTTGQWNTDFTNGSSIAEGKSLHDFFILPDTLVTRMYECIAGKISSPFPETEIHGKDGKHYWISGNITPSYSDEGDISGLILFMNNHTEEKTIREELKVEKEKFRGAFKSSAIGMAIVGLDGRWLHINRSLSRMLGYSRDEMLQLTFQDLTHPEDLQKDLELVAELLQGQRNAYQMEKRYTHRNGQIVWALLSVSIVRDVYGKSLYFVSQVVDITPAKKLEQQRLNEMDGKYQRLASELHENIAQRIAGLKWIVQAALRETSREHAAHITSELSDLIHEVKRLSEAIIPTTFLDDTIYFHLEALLNSQSSRQAFHINADLDERLKHLSLKDAYHSYRIVEDYIKLSQVTGCKIISVNIQVKNTLLIEITYEDSAYQQQTLSNALLWNDISTRLDILEGSVLSTPSESDKGLIRLIIPVLRSTG